MLWVSHDDMLCYKFINLFVCSSVHLTNKHLVLLQNVLPGLVTTLEMLRKFRETAKLDKKAALRMTQQVSVPAPLREPIRLYDGSIREPGAVEYISGLEIEHGSELMPWLHHHVNLDVFEYLTSHKANVNAVENNGWTHLHRASWRGHLSTA